jgi:hypothetical protein
LTSIAVPSDDWEQTDKSTTNAKGPRMCKLRTALGMLLLCLAFVSAPGRTTTFDTNNSDLWWIPSESGWGIQFVQQADVIFATMFVYSPNGTPVWYTATLSHATGYVYSGTLYLTNGPWFGGVFNPAAVTNRPVGTMTFDVPFVAQGTLTYSVDGVTVQKTIVRQTLRFENFTGSYAGALESVNSGCINPLNNGAAEDFVTVSINHSGTSFSMVGTSIFDSSSCTFSGTYSQQGHMGSVVGTYSCTSGVIGNIQMFEMEVSRGGFTSRFEASNNLCGSVYGRLGGGVRRAGF